MGILGANAADCESGFEEWNCYYKINKYLYYTEVSKIGISPRIIQKKIPER